MGLFEYVITRTIRLGRWEVWLFWITAICFVLITPVSVVILEFAARVRMTVRSGQVLRSNLISTQFLADRQLQMSIQDFIRFHLGY